VAYETLISCASVVTIAIIVFACWLQPVGHLAAPGHVQLGGFWGSWMLAVSALIANAISYAPFAGDYARYMPARTPPVSLFIWTLAGMTGGCAVGLGAGVIIALTVGRPPVVQLRHGGRPFLRSLLLRLGIGCSGPGCAGSSAGASSQIR